MTYSSLTIWMHKVSLAINIQSYIDGIYCTMTDDIADNMPTDNSQPNKVLLFTDKQIDTVAQLYNCSTLKSQHNSSLQWKKIIKERLICVLKKTASDL